MKKETRIKISLAKKGKPSNSSTKFKKNDPRLVGNTYASGNKPNQTSFKKGEHRSPATEFRAGQMSARQFGERNSNWRGGVSQMNDRLRSTLEYSLWRTAVYERDNYTCVWCGDNRGGNLQADHIKSFAHYPELRFAIDNGRTLCISCHKTTDTYAGRANKKI